MTIYPSQQTFVRGEISPRLHSRADIDLYKAGLSKCENFITLPHGGIRKRGGSYFVDSAPDETKPARLIPFIFSDDQAYCLVLTHLVMRVYAYGARVGTVEVVTPWTETEIAAVDFVQSADDMWLVHPDHAPRKLTRLAHTSWTLSQLSFFDGPFGAVNTDESVTMYASAASGSGITLHASSAVFQSTDIGRLVRIDIQSYVDIPPWEPNAIITQPTVGVRRRYNGNVYQTPDAYDAPTQYEVRTGATPPTHSEGTEWDGQNSYQTVPDITQAEAETIVNLDVRYGFRWTYLNSGFGIARITGYTSGTQVTADVLTVFPDEVVGSDDTSHIWRLGTFYAGNWPDSVAIFEERLAYGQRFSVSLSKTSDFEEFESGEEADDGLHFRNAGGGQANDITWLADIDGYLAIGTIGGLRSLSGAGIDEALTPSSFKNRNSRSLPCASVSPVRSGQSFAYVTKGRQKIAELRLGQQLRFESEDLGQISEHIAKRGVVELAFQDNPDPMLWFPLDTGELGCLTHQPSQEVRGMHRHLLGGSFGDDTWGHVESVCVTPGQTGNDDVWVVVKRTIGGSTRRYIEILDPPFEYGDVEDAFQVDSGLSRTGSATNAVSGLSHLNGESVDILADGVVYRGRTVAGGSVSLPGGATAAVWSVGLPMGASADTLELDVGGRDGSLMGRKKRIVKVILSVFETDLKGLQIASFLKGRWEPVKLPSIAAPSSASQLYTGNIEVPIDDSWEGQGRVSIRHLYPTPCTIRAMTPAFDNEP